MINVFKKHAPAYKRLVRKFALDVWKDKVNKSTKEDFFGKVERFKRNYERDLIDHYHQAGIKIYPGTIRAKANQWYEDQYNLIESLETIATAKKSELTTELFDKLRTEKSADAQKMLNKIYLTKADLSRGAEVYKVFSFTDNLEAKAMQLGEQQAYDLGADINHDVMTEIGDRYMWMTQDDKRVRKTHQKLNKKTFLYEDPPTTKDQYGHSHTGHPGTDWGCVIGSTRIVFDSDIRTLFRRWYVGKLTAIVTPIGPLYLTPNHPVLTANGWIPAQFLKRSHKIVKIPNKVFEAIKTDITHRYATAEQIFDFFSLFMKPSRISGSTNQFHGDGIPHHKVDIIRTQGELMSVFKSVFCKKIGKFLFPSSDKMRMFISKSSQGYFMAKFRRLFFATIGFMGRTSQFFTLFRGHPRKTNEISLVAITSSNSFASKKLANKRSTNAKTIRAGKLTKPSNVFPDNSGAMNSKNFVRPFFVGHIDYSGYVYNFETNTGMYYANQMASHNCRCWEVPSSAKPFRHFIAEAVNR